MTTKDGQNTVDEMTVEQWLQVRRDEGQKIEPNNAQVIWDYVNTFDPYGVEPELPDECRQIGRGYFARSPGSDIWVCFHDLPSDTREMLWSKHKSELAFPAGIPFVDF